MEERKTAGELDPQLDSASPAALFIVSTQDLVMQALLAALLPIGLLFVYVILRSRPRPLAPVAVTTSTVSARALTPAQTLAVHDEDAAAQARTARSRGRPGWDGTGPAPGQSAQWNGRTCGANA